MVPLFIMPEWFQATTYRTDSFVAFLRAYFGIAPCPLCAEVHRLYIHYYVGRLIRDPATETNVEIVICVIICHIAKSEGKQYTKRMLPPFVTPECNITLEHAFRMVTAMPGGRIDYRYAGNVLGTYCRNTILRHYCMIVTYSEIAVSLLGEYLALIAPFIQLPGQPPYEKLFSLLLSLMKAICQAHFQRSGRPVEPPPALLYLHPVYVSSKSRGAGAGKNLLNLELPIRFYFDSS